MQHKPALYSMSKKSFPLFIIIFFLMWGVLFIASHSVGVHFPIVLLLAILICTLLILFYFSAPLFSRVYIAHDALIYQYFGIKIKITKASIKNIWQAEVNEIVKGWYRPLIESNLTKNLFKSNAIIIEFEKGLRTSFLLKSFLNPFSAFSLPINSIGQEGHGRYAAFIVQDPDIFSKELKDWHGSIKIGLTTPEIKEKRLPTQNLRTLADILQLVFKMFVHPIRSFSVLIEARPIKNVLIVLAMAVILMIALGFLYLILTGRIPFSIGKISAGLLATFLTIIIIFPIIASILFVISVFYSWVGRHLFGGTGNYEDIFLTLVLFVAACFITLVPIWFIEKILLTNHLLTNALNASFTIFYVTVAFKVAHKMSTMKALALFLLPFFVLFMLGICIELIGGLI